MSLETEALQATPPTSTLSHLRKSKNLNGSNAGIPLPLCKTIMAPEVVVIAKMPNR
ncbi:hypothetical protein ACEYW6_24150 [Nostoc sp. UIC 10607]|uniref:hypothetical protein n=1 Tax=Nostoc sp. UIC 10607 TaxID=3045935 RepID=UPI00399FF57A